MALSKLEHPYPYIVSYDLKQSPLMYSKLFNELKASVSWWHYLSNTWIVLRYESLAELGPNLVGMIYTSDRLIVMPAKGPASGYLPQEAWDWINKGVPKEWSGDPSWMQSVTT